ncbi:MAG: hypothetical protein KA184_21050, partial [Candidatus Hydrogenedentes bacterium]|nr:hypothetical protein [Candidatus Hydrogenedentota bacterium]
STGAGRDICAGYCTASPAKKYYQAPYWEVTNPTTWAYRNADWEGYAAGGPKGLESQGLSA